MIIFWNYYFNCNCVLSLFNFTRDSFIHIIITTVELANNFIKKSHHLLYSNLNFFFFRISRLARIINIVLVTTYISEYGRGYFSKVKLQHSTFLIYLKVWNFLMSCVRQSRTGVYTCIVCICTYLHTYISITRFCLAGSSGCYSCTMLAFAYTKYFYRWIVPYLV